MNITYKIIQGSELKKLELDRAIKDIEDKLDKDQTQYMEFNKDILSDFYVYSVALDGNKLVGSIQSIENNKDDSLTKDMKVVRFNEVYVEPNYRRLGIASNLIKNLLDYWKSQYSHVKFTLGVFANNKNALKLYEKFGFRPYLYKMINKNFSLFNRQIVNFSYELMNKYYNGQTLFKLDKDEINCGPDESSKFYIFEIKSGSKNDYDVDDDRSLYVIDIINHLCKYRKDLAKDLKLNIDKYNECLPGIYLQELDNGTNNGDYDKLYKIDNTVADHGKTFRNYQILREMAKDYPGCSDDGFHYLCMSLIGKNKVVNLDPARLVFDVSFIRNKNFSLIN